MGMYRLEKVGEETVVIPPPYANVSPGKTLRFELASGNGKGLVNSRDCSAVSGPLKLLGVSSGWTMTLPSLRAWSREAANGVFHQHIEDILGQIDVLALRGCMSVSKAMLFEQAVLEAVPVAIPQTPLYRYGYSAGGGVINLEPGMRLVIQRAEYDRSHKFLGTEIVYCKITRDPKGGLHIRSVKTERRGHARIFPGDVNLGEEVRGANYLRLYFSGKFVPHNLNYSALVVGTRSLKHMEEIARELRAHPQNGCPARTGKDAACKPYFGMVTVVAELGVKMNGTKVFVAPGDNVRAALEKTGNASCVKDIRALRIEREFLGHPVRVKFDPKTESALHLDLVANDRISCSANNIKPSGKQAPDLKKADH